MSRRFGMVLALAAATPAADAWVTISQSRFGAQLSTIRAQYGVNSSVPYSIRVQNMLGYLWTSPEAPQSHRGLGGGIAWAWDPALCDTLLDRFHEGARAPGSNRQPSPSPPPPARSPPTLTPSPCAQTSSS